MDKQNRKFTKEEGEARLCAVREPRFTAEDLALEIEPLIKSYFVGKFERDNGSINCSFLNGQKFSVKVETVC